jgi:alpha-ketoglutarate-dependent taurine dioxygenase
MCLPASELGGFGERDAVPDTGVLGHLAELVARHGAVRVQGTGVASAADLRRAASALGCVVPALPEESSPRTRLDDGVWTSTDYPARFPIQFHNEFSYAACWPRLVLFACLRPPDEGGETLLADSRAVLARLSPSTRAEFATRGLLYERNYSARSGVGWQDAFGTGDPGAVEAHCRSRGMAWRWRGDELSTRQAAPAVETHPVSGRDVWFNHALLFHVRGLEPDWLRRSMERVPPGARASNSYFGDGEDIPAGHLDEVRDAYAGETVAGAWRAGDVLVVDNMLCAHARAPYAGPRQVVVAMVDEWHRAGGRGREVPEEPGWNR